MKSAKQSFGVGGHFKVTCFDKDGNVKWETNVKNGVTDQGLNNMLDVYFSATDSVGGESTGGTGGTGTGGTGVGDGWGWALGLIDFLNFSALAPTDKHNWHNGWREFTWYTAEGNSYVRPQWVPTLAASKNVGNVSVIDYGITKAGTVAGLFLAGGSIDGAMPVATDADKKGSMSPVPLLWSTAQFTTPQIVKSGDVLRVTYVVSAQST